MSLKIPRFYFLPPIGQRQIPPMKQEEEKLITSEKHSFIRKISSEFPVDIRRTVLVIIQILPFARKKKVPKNLKSSYPSRLCHY